MLASTVPVSAAHMLLHVLMMSAVAPLGIAALRIAAHRMAAHRWLHRGEWRASPSNLWFATGLQLVVFLYWHSPSAMTHAMHAWSGALLLQVSLLAAAGLFWWCIAGLQRDKAWHAIAALLVTGKTFCLVAVILTFAPRPLYHMMSVGDQQLAGLIMITLCPLTYVASALWLCRRWLLRFDVPASP
ncbi:MAG: cytochrome c oxidase assembly protein [Pseudomonadota bacterium]|nr:cytochrome c oxidase assembly protein [Pseudomonadota bacterium]